MVDWSSVLLLVTTQEGIDQLTDEMIQQEFYPIGIVWTDNGRLVMPFFKFKTILA